MAVDRFRSWTPRERLGVLIPSGPVKHLFFVLTDPCPEQRVALVNVSTIRAGRYHDPTCVIDVGDHPFIKHPSYAFYQGARVETVLVLRHGLQTGDFALHTEAPIGLHRRLLEGLLVSDATPQVVVTYVTGRLPPDKS